MINRPIPNPTQNPNVVSITFITSSPLPSNPSSPPTPMPPLTHQTYNQTQNSQPSAKPTHTKQTQTKNSPHRPRPLMPIQMTQFLLREQFLAVDGIHDVERAVWVLVFDAFEYEVHVCCGGWVSVGVGVSVSGWEGGLGEGVGGGRG